MKLSTIENKIKKFERKDQNIYEKRLVFFFNEKKISKEEAMNLFRRLSKTDSNVKCWENKNSLNFKWSSDVNSSATYLAYPEIEVIRIYKWYRTEF